MTQPLYTPTPKSVTVGGKSFKMLAFYYNDAIHSWEQAYAASYLANFWPCTLTVTVPVTTSATKTATFHNAEAAFQALKFWDDDAVRNQFTQCKLGSQAYHIKKAHRSSANDSYAGFGGNKQGMDAVLAAKFQDTDLKQGLLDTADAYLLEHNEHQGRDSIWSDNSDGTGTNWLGHALMSLREILGGTGNPASPSQEYSGGYNQFTPHV